MTDQLRSYPAAKAEIPELADVRHVFVKARARVNNRAENSHQASSRGSGSALFSLSEPESMEVHDLH